MVKQRTAPEAQVSRCWESLEEFVRGHDSNNGGNVDDAVAAGVIVPAKDINHRTRQAQDHVAGWHRPAALI